MNAICWPPWLEPPPGDNRSFLGTVQPAGWGPAGQQWQCLQQELGAVPLLGWSVVELTGQDAQGFLHNLCTNEIRSLAPGQGNEAFLTDPKGHIVAQVFALVESEQVVLVSVPGSVPEILKHLDYYLITEDVEFHDRSPQRALFLLAGARVPEALARWECPLAPEHPWRHARLEKFPAWRAAAVDWLPGPAMLLLGPAEEAGQLWSWLREQGAVPVGFELFDAARIQQAMPWFGQDITRDNLPQESGRTGQAVSFTKGCYVGQETVARLENLGHVNRQVRLLRWEPKAEVPPVGEELQHEGKTAGTVTSAAWHPGWQCPVGLALVRREALAPGTRLDSRAGSCCVLVPGGTSSEQPEA